MTRILLTGGTGFVGRHCPLLLAARGYEVHATTSRPPADQSGPVRWYQVDLLDAAQVREVIAAVRPTHLLHFAWYVAHGLYWTTPANLDWVRASVTLLQAFAEAGGQRVVMAGTCAEYDWRYGYCSEGVTPLCPSTLYGTAKHALQLLLEAYAQQANLSAAWGRLFFLYGPDEAAGRLVPSVVQALLRREPVGCTHGRQVRDFLHVADAAAAFVALLDQDVRGPLNIASGAPVALREVIATVASQLGGEGLVHYGSRPSPPDDPPLLVADVRRLREEIGWQPTYDLANGLADTISWWREREALQEYEDL
jgi:nucleoside-diphosphate-sugar epimerase